MISRTSLLSSLICACLFLGLSTGANGIPKPEVHKPLRIKLHNAALPAGHAIMSSTNTKNKKLSNVSNMYSTAKLWATSQRWTEMFAWLPVRIHKKLWFQYSHLTWTLQYYVKIWEKGAEMAMNMLATHRQTVSPRCTRETIPSHSLVLPCSILPGPSWVHIR